MNKWNQLESEVLTKVSPLLAFPFHFFSILFLCSHLTGSLPENTAVSQSREKKFFVRVVIQYWWMVCNNQNVEQWIVIIILYGEKFSLCSRKTRFWVEYTYIFFSTCPENHFTVDEYKSCWMHIGTWSITQLTLYYSCSAKSYT